MGQEKFEINLFNDFNDLDYNFFIAHKLVLAYIDSFLITVIVVRFFLGPVFFCSRNILGAG